MPGYLVNPITEAGSIPFAPAGNITANNLQDALTQLDSSNSSLSASVTSAISDVSSVSASVSAFGSDISNISASVSSVQDSISSVEGVALLGL